MYLINLCMWEGNRVTIAVKIVNVILTYILVFLINNYFVVSNHWAGGNTENGFGLMRG